MNSSANPVGISVVLCARNEERWIRTQLEALASQDPGMPWEVIVVDNGSTDSTAMIVGEFSRRLSLRLVHLSTPGHSRARNSGVAAARYPFIAHCDADDEVSAGWLAAIAGCLASNPLVTGPMDETALNHANSWARPRVPRGRLPVALDFLPYAVGANIAYRREVHTAIAGWDPAFRTGAEDVDFSWRAQHAGFEITFCSQAVVRYRHRDSGRGLARQFLGYGLTEPLLLKRHAPSGLKRQPLRRAGRRWLTVIRRLPAVVRHPEQRADWIVTASWSAGRALGSIQHRSLLL